MTAEILNLNFNIRKMEWLLALTFIETTWNYQHSGWILQTDILCYWCFYNSFVCTYIWFILLISTECQRCEVDILQATIHHHHHPSSSSSSSSSIIHRPPRLKEIKCFSIYQWSNRSKEVSFQDNERFVRKEVLY